MQRHPETKKFPLCGFHWSMITKTDWFPQKVRSVSFQIWRETILNASVVWDGRKPRTGFYNTK